MPNRIKIIENYVSNEDCDAAVSTINGFNSSGQLEPFHANGTVLVAPSDDPSVVSLLAKYSNKVLASHREEYGFLPNLYTTEAWLSLWGPGSEAGIHSDAHDGYEFLLYATVLYLNDSDDYVGGEIYFPNQGLSYRPKRGDAVLFPCAGHEHIHGVRQIIEGSRYTVAMWHTKRPDKASKFLHPGIAGSVKTFDSGWFSSYSDSREQINQSGNLPKRFRDASNGE